MARIDGSRLKAARIEAGFGRLEDLSAAAGVAIGTLSQLESGKKSGKERKPVGCQSDTLFNIARALGKPMDYFFELEVQENEPSAPAPEPADAA
jgi:transcriptional regulator with XRE-family HTH domain